MYDIGKDAGAIEMSLRRIHNIRRALKQLLDCHLVQVTVAVEVPKYQPGEVVEVSGPGEAERLRRGEVPPERLSLQGMVDGRLAIEILHQSMRREAHALREHSAAVRAGLSALLSELDGGNVGS